MDLEAILRDREAEAEDLERLVSGLDDADWQRPTPAPGWTIAHQISHLAWTDTVATLAATDTVTFHEILLEAITDPNGLVDRTAAEGIGRPDEMMHRWRIARNAHAEAVRATPPDQKLAWFGPPMSRRTTATARLMETWAHGQDVADALGVQRVPTERLQHVAFIGVRTLGYGFVSHGRPAPTEPVRVELTAPDGDLWTFGPDDAEQRLTGPALDFALLVTQRRHRDDLALTPTGKVADEWLDVAQAFAGPPGAGRAPTGTRP